MKNDHARAVRILTEASREANSIPEGVPVLKVSLILLQLSWVYFKIWAQLTWSRLRYR